MIPLVRLHHVSFAVKDLAASRRFFGGVLGLPEMERPAFSFPGAWYALGDRQLHLIAESSGERQAADRISRSDHMALEVSDVGSVKKALRSAGIEFGEGGNQALGMDQIFCRDPDGQGDRVCALSLSAAVILKPSANERSLKWQGRFLVAVHPR